VLGVFGLWGCANDIIAQGVIAAINSLTHHCIKVVSCHHIPNSAVINDHLTTVAISTTDIAKRCLLILQELLQNTAPPVKTLVNVNLQIRDSSQ